MVCYTVLFLSLFVLVRPIAADPAAFPGAVGFGATSEGGRGGDVYRVTKLEDRHEKGTLRDAIDTADGPRTVVFEVGGTIKLRSTLHIHSRYLTIAGQTAPGPGITLTDYPVALEDARHVIIRFLRIRTGDRELKGNGGDLKGNLADGLSISDCDEVIIDHCSLSWGIDETLSLVDSTNVTIQDCFITESLRDSYHPEGDHGMGALLRGNVDDPGRNLRQDGYTVIRNLFAHHNARNPGFAGSQDGRSGGLYLDFVNNVIYDWGFRSGHSLSGGDGVRMNYIGNYLIAGPSTGGRNDDQAFEENHSENFRLFHDDNLLDSDGDSRHDGERVKDSAFPGVSSSEEVSQPFRFATRNLFRAGDAYSRVLRESGASLVRDEIDERLEDQVRRRRGGIIDSQKEVGGLSDTRETSSQNDDDRDGIDDDFEKEFGLNPKDSKDRNKETLGTPELGTEGYTNLEIYLDFLVSGRQPATHGQEPVGGGGSPSPPREEDVEPPAEEPADIVQPPLGVFPFSRGDCNGDGTVCGGVADALKLATWLFANNTEPPCRASCDANADGRLDLTDAISSLETCFLGRPSPLFPAVGCQPPSSSRERRLGCAAATGSCQ